MRQWLIGIGLCSLACGDTSLPRFPRPSSEARNSRSSSTEASSAAMSSAAMSSAAMSPADGANGSPAAEPSAAGAPAAESPEQMPGEAPAAEATPVVPGAPDGPAPGTPLAPAPSNAPSSEGGGSSPPAAETPGAAAPGTESPDLEAPDPATPRSSDGLSGETPDRDAPGSDGPGSDLPSDAPRVTVSFTFDDTYKPQRDAAAILEAHGLRGTFYVNSPQLHRAQANPSANSSLSISEVLAMQARGHDIGGHTLGHPSLTDLPEVERSREILGDRAQLVHLGLDARSFAYPYGHVENDPDRSLGRPVLEIARESGYSSARDTNGFILGNCNRGPESLPPTDPFILRSVHSVSEPATDAEQPEAPDTAATLLAWVDEAARCGGGWLPLVFHHLREDCSAPDAPAGGYCFDFAELDRLAEELARGTRCPGGDEEDCYRIRVATVSETIGDSDVAPAPEVSGLRNASLERTLDSGETECLQQTKGDGSTAVFSRSEIAHSGQSSARVEISAPYVAAAEFRVERDYGECSIFVSEGGSYDVSLYYRASPEAAIPTLRFVSYRLTSDYAWERWTTGGAFTAQSPGNWVRLAFTTPAVPSDTIAISFGLRLESTGVLYVDDLDAGPAAQ